MAAKNPTGEPDPAPFKVHLMTRAGRVMRARSEPVRTFSTKDEAVRFAGRQLGGHYAVYPKDRKKWPTPCRPPAHRTRGTRPKPRQYSIADWERARERVAAAERRIDNDRTNNPNWGRAGLERAQLELSVIVSQLRLRGLLE